MNEILFFDVVRRLREKHLEFLESKQNEQVKEKELSQEKTERGNYILSFVEL